MPRWLCLALVCSAACSRVGFDVAARGGDGPAGGDDAGWLAGDGAAFAGDLAFGDATQFGVHLSLQPSVATVYAGDTWVAVRIAVTQFLT